jgi:hypothetical protein
MLKINYKTSDSISNVCVVEGEKHEAGECMLGCYQESKT